MKYVYKSKILIYSIITIFVLSFTFLLFKINEKTSENNYNVKYVNKIESELYEFIKVYNYNDNSGQYEVTDYIVTKNNSLYEIFYYYNDENYEIKSLELNNDILYITLKDVEDLNLFCFRKMKLSYKFLNINTLIVKNNGIEYIIK